METTRDGSGFSGRRIVCLLVFCLAVVMTDAGDVHAFNIEMGSDASLDFDLTLKYGGAWRVKDQSGRLIADPNADDGNRNFDQWDMVNNRLSATADIVFKYKEKYGLFVRPRAYYDFAYDGRNANDSVTTNNNGPLYGGPLSKTDEFDPETQELHRDKAEILDAFAFSEFEMGGHNLVFRVGRQVVSWGEGLFFLNSISSAQSPADATALNAPGVELKEVFLPVGQAYAQIDLIENLTLAGYWQYEWDKTRLDEAGSYFSTADILDDAGRRILIPLDLSAGLAATIDRTSDEDPSDSGQYGLALRYLTEKLNNMEFGLYFINYHEQLPQLIGEFSGGTVSQNWGTIIPDPATAGLFTLLDGSSYHLRYAEDVKLYGASFSTVVGDTNVGGEVSYRRNLPIAVDDASNILGLSYERAKVLQTQLSIIHILGSSRLWDNLTLTGEAAWNRVVGGLDGKSLANDRSAWGITLIAGLDYYQVRPGLDLSIPITYKGNPNGISSVLGTFDEDNDSVAINFNFTYRDRYKFGIGYTEFLHGPEKNPLSDRDYLTTTLQYTF
jgi:hypothetical protein